MAKRYLNTIVSRSKASNLNTQVSPSNGSNTAKPLRPTFTFLNMASVFASVVAALPSDAPDVLQVMCGWYKALRKARMKITTLT